MALDDAFSLQDIGGTEIAAIDASGNMELAGTVSGVNVDAGGYEDQSLTGNLTLTGSNATLQRISLDQARDVILPAEATSAGRWFRILNTTGSALDITVKDDGGSTIVTVSQNEAANVFCNGTAWKHGGIETIALS
jgi:hypothetical protein